jgi:hypothetical protein
MYKNAPTRGVENESLAWIDAGKKASAASRFLPRRGRPFFRKIMARSGRSRRRSRDFDFFHDFLSAARLVVRILNRQKHARQFRAARLPCPSCRTMSPLPPLKRN